MFAKETVSNANFQLLDFLLKHSLNVVNLLVGWLVEIDLHVQVEPRDILDYGVIPELAGRIPVVVTLDSLTQVLYSLYY